MSTNRLIEHDGKRLTVAQWSIETGIPQGTIHARFKRLNWPTGKALTTPTRKGAKL